MFCGSSTGPVISACVGVYVYDTGYKSPAEYKLSVLKWCSSLKFFCDDCYCVHDWMNTTDTGSYESSSCFWGSLYCTL